MPPDIEAWLVEAAAVLDRLILGWRPTSAELISSPTIDRWAIVEAPDGTIRLMGKVTGHPNLRVGRGPLTLTSALLWLDTDLGWARTASRFYFLGLPEGSQVVPLSHAERADIALRAGAWLERERDCFEN